MFKKNYKRRLLAIFLTVTLVPLLFMGIGVVMQFKHINTQYSDMESFYDHINQLKYNFGAMMVMSLSIIMLSVVWISDKMAQPMIALRDATREVALGKFNTKLKIEFQDELGEVMGAFNDMASTIQHSYDDLQKQASQLMESNVQLQEMNMELEASYEQMAATTEQLNESEQKYRLLIENISDMVWAIDTEGRITYINDEVENILDYHKEAVMGKKFSNIMCPLHQYECDDIIEQMKLEDFDKKDLWMLSSDGGKRLILETSTRRIYHQTQLIGIQGLGRDVTEYVRIKNEIIRKNEELTLLNDISSSLTNTLSTVHTDILLQSITDKIVEMIRVDICTIRLLDANGMLEFKTTSGSLSHLVNREAIPLIRGDIGEAVIQKKIVEYDDFDSRENMPYYVEQVKSAHKVKHVIYIPLLIEEQVIGVMGIGSSKKIDQTNYNILIALSNHAAVAIEKAKLYENLKQYYFKTIKALATAVEVKDTYTQGHSIRVSQYAVLIGKYMGLDEHCLDELETAGILHDIGKIGISDRILTKPGRLEPGEYEVIKQHTIIGSRILKPIGLDEEVMKAILLHHKRYDLQGYPEDAMVDELPLYAQIIGVADAFDAMISNRSYKLPITIESARMELKRFSGTQFDPFVVEVLDNIITQHLNEIEKIANIS